MTPPVPVLRFEDVDTFYGPVHILAKVSLEVGEGELVALLGGNACGKSTTLKTALGMVRPRSGKVFLRGVDITDRPSSERIKAGVAVVPERTRYLTLNIAGAG